MSLFYDEKLFETLFGSGIYSSIVSAVGLYVYLCLRLKEGVICNVLFRDLKQHCFILRVMFPFVSC